MPSDITGTDIIEEDRGRAGESSGSSPGRCSPTSSWPTRSTGAAEDAGGAARRRCRNWQVTVGRRRIQLPPPFFVIATQNPDRAGGDVSAARGPARPVHVQRPRSYPTPDEEEGLSPARPRTGKPRSIRSLGRRDHAVAGVGPRRASRRSVVQYAATWWGQRGQVTSRRPTEDGFTSTSR